MGNVKVRLEVKFSLAQFNFIYIAPFYCKVETLPKYRENPDAQMTSYEQTLGDRGKEKLLF